MALSLLTLLLIVSAAWYENHRQRQIVRLRASENLETMIHYKTELIKTWYLQRLQSAEDLADAWRLEHPEGAAMAEPLPPDLERWLPRLGEAGFVAVAALNAEGKPLPWRVYNEQASVCTSPRHHLAWPPAQTSLSNMHTTPGGWLHLDILAPLAGGHRTPDDPAFLLFSMDAWRSVLRIVAVEPNNTETGETLLVQEAPRGLVYVNPTRFGGHPPLSLRETPSSDNPAWKALQGDILWGTGRDYRGRRIIYATHYIPWVRWGIVGKMDESEVYATMRTTAILAWTVSILSFCLIVLALYAGWSRHHERETRVLNTALAEKKAALEQTMKRLFSAHEEERHQLSRELHDDVVQALGAADLHLHSLEERAKMPTASPAGQHLLHAREAVSLAATECREILGRYRPPGFEADALIPRIREAAARVPHPTVHVHIQESAIWSRLSFEAAAACYRIVQEALANLRRHAEASEAWIDLSHSEDALALEIRDDGRGFTVETAPKPLHCGLETMRERARLVGGTCEITSAEGKGTTLRVVMPAWVQGEENPR